MSLALMCLPHALLYRPPWPCVHMPIQCWTCCPLRLSSSTVRPLKQWRSSIRSNLQNCAGLWVSANVHMHIHYLHMYVCTLWWMFLHIRTYYRSSSFNESDKVPGYQDFVTPAQPGSGKVKRKLPVVRKQRIESGDQGETLSAGSMHCPNHACQSL